MNLKRLMRVKDTQDELSFIDNVLRDVKNCNYTVAFQDRLSSSMWARFEFKMSNVTLSIDVDFHYKTSTVDTDVRIKKGDSFKIINQLWGYKFIPDEYNGKLGRETEWYGLYQVGDKSLFQSFYKEHLPTEAFNDLANYMRSDKFINDINKYKD